MGLGKLEERTGKRGKFSKLKSIINKYKNVIWLQTCPFTSVLVRIRVVAEVT